jgi:DNA mismatch repair protein MutS
MSLTAVKQPSEAALTPMMRQYFEIKHQYPDAILMYRLGDFYEMFYEDAVTASGLLDLTLTSRNKNDDNPVPLCGVPYHAVESYLAKLVQNGKKVVICEQVEDAKFAKGIVRREVTRVVTPGTVMEAQSLDAGSHNFLMCFTKTANAYPCAVCDVSTGRLEYFDAVSADRLHGEIARLQAREIIHPEALRNDPDLARLAASSDNLYRHAAPDLTFDTDFAADLVRAQFRVGSLAALGLEDDTDAVRVLGGLLGYLKDAKLLAPDLLQQPLRRLAEEHMFLDETAIGNLELFKTQREGQKRGTLAWHLDACQTPMGSRKLGDVLRAPLLKPDEINARLDAVAELVCDPGLSGRLQEALAGVADLERLANRFILGSANARDATALASSLDRAAGLKGVLTGVASPLLREWRDGSEDFAELRARIASTLVDEPPLSVRDGGIIRDGVDPALDELRAIERGGKDFILGIEKRERERSGVASLKIRYNNVFGYYIEISNAHKDKVPSDYVRKQTLANAERYITDELKDYEAKVLGASERIRALEAGLFQKLAGEIATEAARVKKTAGCIAMIDVLRSFADTAVRFRYVRPRVTTGLSLDLKGARHPILERLHPSEQFVPNDVCLDSARAPQLIITGPNMAGKSTLMRMTALVAIMAQAGSFVPCESAEIGVCDRVFTRIGAHDHLQKGLSTFMVEMVETARILREATTRSLVLLDEIGRGTSTFDGLSIAWAVAEDLCDRLRARTLFATHYHELCDLADKRKGVKNGHMAVKEWNGEIIFLRKLSAGGTNRSYGVAVAGMAGLPPAVVKRAREVLKLLEVKDLSFQTDMGAESDNQLSLFQTEDSGLLRELRNVDVNALTPIEALNVLAELKKKFVN